jgi:orotidine-5'-phosphate decarboxylase
VLTSLSDSDLSEELGFSESAEQTVLRLAQLAKAAGLDGVVASVREAADIRQMCGREFVIVTPGIRPAWAEAGDQARIATPRAALEAGADYLVIGRPITHADDPRQALSRVLDEMAA